MALQVWRVSIRSDVSNNIHYFSLREKKTSFSDFPSFFIQVAAAGLLSLAIFVLIKAEDVVGFHISTDLSSENPTAVHFSILLVSSYTYFRQNWYSLIQKWSRYRYITRAS
jgi:hypothetical protein